MDRERRERVDRKMAQFRQAWGNAERAKTYQHAMPQDLHAPRPRCQNCGNLSHRCPCGHDERATEAGNDQLGAEPGGRHVRGGAAEPSG